MKLQKYTYLLAVFLILVIPAGCWPASIPSTFEVAARSSGNTSGNITTQTKDLSKKVNLALTVTVFLLILATYGILTMYSTELAREFALPPKLLEVNITAILSKAWPKQYTEPLSDAPPHNSTPWVLFRKGPCTDVAEGPCLPGEPTHYKLQGFSDVPGLPTAGPSRHADSRGTKASAIKIRIFSPIMRSLVQAAVWNFVSRWLVLVMVANTVVLNGFTSNNLTNDSILRLILVGVYALTNLLAQWYISTQLYDNFTCIVFQTCWTFLSGDFVFIPRWRYDGFRRQGGSSYTAHQGYIESWSSIRLQLFGKTNRPYNYALGGVDGSLEFLENRHLEPHRDGNCIQSKRADDGHDDNPKLPRSFLAESDRYGEESEFDIGPARGPEIKAYEKAAEAILEKIYANVIALLGICLTSALAPWTSMMDTNDATTSELGSHALLLTTSTGILAITGIMSQTKNATKSAWRLLQYQECAIEAAATGEDRVDNLPVNSPEMSFTNGFFDELVVTATGLWGMASLQGKLASILLGPALTLIPGVHRYCNDREKIDLEIDKVEGKVHFAPITGFDEPTGPKAGRKRRVWKLFGLSESQV